MSHTRDYKSKYLGFSCLNVDYSFIDEHTHTILKYWKAPLTLLLTLSFYDLLSPNIKPISGIRFSSLNIILSSA